MDDVSRPEAGDSDDNDGAPIVFTPRELEMIAEAEEEVERLGTIPAEEVFAWVESLGADAPLPMPLPRK